MFSKNITVFVIICGTLAAAMLLGLARAPLSGPADPAARAIEKPHASPAVTYPHIGRIQVLNGCGAAGAANEVADFLRARYFDVKDIGNAETANYDATLVISRTKNMTVATRVAGVLSTDRVVLMRNEDSSYDVTVIIGRDYKERTR